MNFSPTPRDLINLPPNQSLAVGGARLLREAKKKLVPLHGAHTQQILASVLRTAQRGLDTSETLTQLLRAPRPTGLDALQLAPAIH